MNCSKCGAENIDGVTFCGNCGSQMELPVQQQPPPLPPQYEQQPQAPLPPQYQQQPYGGGYNQSNMYSTPAGGPSNGGMIPPKNYLVESIIVTIVSFVCCCSSPISVILGIIAIIKANNVNSEFEIGNVSEAIKNSESAKKLTIWAGVVAILFALICWILYFAIFAASMSAGGAWDEILRNM